MNQKTNICVASKETKLFTKCLTQLTLHSWKKWSFSPYKRYL